MLARRAGEEASLAGAAGWGGFDGRAFVLAARIRLVFLGLSQVSRVLADWGLRLTALLAIRQPGQHDSAWYLVTAVFIAPAILLAPFHGSISNGLPRRWVLVGAALTSLLAFAAFVPAGPWVECLGVVAVGSALYSPTRYAVLPAAARDARLPLNSVNGWMELGSAAAIVGGVILGLRATGEVRPGLPLVVVLLLGLNVVCVLGALPAHFPSDVRRPEPPLQAVGGFFRDSRRIFADAESRGSLLALAVFQGIVTAGSGAVFTLALDNESSGHTAALVALVLVGAGVALGCGLASLQTHPRRSLGLVPFALTGLLGADLWAALANVGGIAPAAACLLLGIMGGLVSVPLRTTYLAAVPADARGNAMSVMNAIIYTITTAIALLMFALARTGVLGSAQSQLWFVVAVVAAAVGVAWRVLMSQALEQFIEWVIWPMYRIKARGPGVGKLPARGPLLLVANHSSYFDPCWIAKVVPRGLTPMMTSDFYDLPVIRWLMVHVVKAIRVERKRFRRQAPELEEAIAVLRRGGCVLLFPESFLRRKEEVPLRQFGQGLWHILRAVPGTPVVAFWIEGGWGSYASYAGGRPMQGKGLDWWRPIDVAVAEPQVLNGDVMADHRTARRYLMRACLEARRHLGLEVPAVGTEEAWEADEEEESKTS